MKGRRKPSPRRGWVKPDPTKVLVQGHTIYATPRQEAWLRQRDRDDSRIDASGYASAFTTYLPGVARSRGLLDGFKIVLIAEPGEPPSRRELRGNRMRKARRLLRRAWRRKGGR